MRGAGSVAVLLLCVLLSPLGTEVSTAPSEDEELTLTHEDLAEDRKRVRRAASFSDRSVGDLSEEVKRLFVEKHNYFRAQEGASDMKYMYWDDDLEKFAKEWVAGCDFSHSSTPMRENVGPYGYVGENLYASTGSYDPAAIMRGWVEEEKPFYNYQTGECGNVCGHYTQAVWANSHAVGCAVKYCEDLKSVRGFKRGFLVSCNYGPGGNYGGVKPYKRGKECSQCGRDEPYCVQKMCAASPVVGGDSSSRGRPCFSLIGCYTLTSLSVVIGILTTAFFL